MPDRPAPQAGLGLRIETLYLSVKSVETYRDRIRQKSDLKNGTELAH
jgi:hypothetical protein